MQWIICYDIQQTKQRTQACRTLRRTSSGYQHSGFEVTLEHEQEITALTEELISFLTPTDSLLILSHSGTGPDWQLGTGATLSPDHFLIWT